MDIFSRGLKQMEVKQGQETLIEVGSLGFAVGRKEAGPTPPWVASIWPFALPWWRYSESQAFRSMGNPSPFSILVFHKLVLLVTYTGKWMWFFKGTLSRLPCGCLQGNPMTNNNFGSSPTAFGDNPISETLYFWRRPV